VSPVGRALVLPAVIALAGVIVLAGLGVWQLQRLQWKEALIARVESRIHSAPVPAPGPDAWRPFDIERFDYQPVEATGLFLHDKEIHVFAAIADPKGPVGGVGYRVMTPLQTEDGWYLIVNRGFVPEDHKDPASRSEGQLPAEVTVTGLVRRAEPAGAFTPGKDVARNIWFNRDPAEMAVAMGLPPDRVAPYTVDAVFDPSLPGGLPQGGETIVNFPNSHLSYALTWFGLAAALLAVFALWARGRLRP
jgi:surfeit locus 1 family protein